MMAECLVPERIVPSYIQMIYVACDRAREDLGKKLLACDKPSFSEIPITVEPERFFQPVWSARLTPTVSLIRGDMFFSKMQTLTVSVNCVGVMGKGLASTAKDRFPDVYVRYEKVCRNKSLQIGKPYLYKRESSVIEQLAEPTLLPSENRNDHSQTWFLLFPTKNHWKNNSTLIDIENGLQWLCENYKSEGIKSLAMPALGCGLGGLEWRDVGPLMCKYLTSIDIPVAIYLPSEGKLSDDLVSRDFLLSQV
ncbi:MAG: macro domain-containing protein [Microcoleus sp.]